ncbi:MAG: ubiquinone/menaquinone biosynthesis methyltransferase [Elusimicrobiota bacterium]
MPDKTPSAVSGFYDGIFHYYEAVNSFMTLGLAAYWRTKAAALALVSKPAVILDVCCGTGALTLKLLRLSGGRISVIGADFNRSMLEKARTLAPESQFLETEASHLPFPDDSFDALTISFATRNLCQGGNDLVKYFREFRRVLKPGGVFVHLETSQPSNRFIRLLFHAHVKLMIGLVNAFFPKTKAAYNFLSETIAAFHTPDELSKAISRAGFSKVEAFPLTFGAVAIHKAIK